MQELTFYVKVDLKCHTQADAPALPGLVRSSCSKGIDERAASYREAGTTTGRNQSGTSSVHADAAAQTDAMRPRPAFETGSEPPLFTGREDDRRQVEVRRHRRQARRGAVGDAGPELPVEGDFLDAVAERRLLDVPNHEACPQPTEFGHCPDVQSELSVGRAFEVFCHIDRRT